MRKKSDILKTASAILAVLAFVTYYTKAYYTYPDVPELFVKHVLRDGLFLSLSMVFLGVGIEEQNRKLKYLIYYSASFFFAWLTLSYWLNDICNVVTPLNKIFVSLALTTITCFVVWAWQLFSLRK